MVEPDAALLGKSGVRARRQHVVDVSRRLFAENGFHGTGIAGIAKESGILVGQIYRDFADKEDIIGQIVEQDCVILTDRVALEAAVHSGDCNAIREWIERVIDPTTGRKPDPRIFAEIVAESARNERMATIFRAAHDEVRSTLRSALTVLAPSPAKVEDRELLVEIILTFAVGLINRNLIENDPLDHALIAALTETIAAKVASLAAVA